MRTLEEWKELLIKFADEYDSKQARKSGWNPYAYEHYVTGILDAIKEPYFLENPKCALMQHFIVRGETGGIYHRNLPKGDLTEVKFVLSFLNNKKLWEQ